MTDQMTWTVSSGSQTFASFGASTGALTGGFVGGCGVRGLGAYATQPWDRQIAGFAGRADHASIEKTPGTPAWRPPTS